MGTRPRVAITGASGVIGSVLVNRLADRYDIVGIDRVAPRSPGPSRVVDLRNLKAACRALEGVEFVIDLVNDPRSTKSWRITERNNLRASINTLEAARCGGARRVIIASSNWVTAGYHAAQPYARILADDHSGIEPGSYPLIAVKDPVSPLTPYGIGKAVVERVAERFTRQSDLSVICLRLGTVTSDGRPRHTHELSKLLTHDDLEHLVERCLEAPDTLRFAVYYGVSHNTWKVWDIENAQREIGYAPRDNAEAFRPGLSAPRPARSGLGATRARIAHQTILGLLGGLDGLVGNKTGNRLEHSLATATLATRAEADDDLVVAALCHDIGSALGAGRHGALSAAILRPYLRPEVAWAISVHEDFVATHDFRGPKRYRRYLHRWSPHYALARRLVDEWDVPSRQVDDALPLAFFTPTLCRVLERSAPRRRSRARRVLSVVTRPLPQPWRTHAKAFARRVRRLVRSARRP